MAKLLVLYNKPKSAEAFDSHYASVHIPLAKKIPGLRKYDISQGATSTPAGPAGIHLVATLYFDSMDAVKAALASPEGQAAAGDLANFADGGAELYFFDTLFFRYKGSLSGPSLFDHPRRETPATARCNRLLRAGQIATMPSICALRRRTC